MACLYSKTSKIQILSWTLFWSNVHDCILALRGRWAITSITLPTFFGKVTMLNRYSTFYNKGIVTFFLFFPLPFIGAWLTPSFQIQSPTSYTGHRMTSSNWSLMPLGFITRTEERWGCTCIGLTHNCTCTVLFYTFCTSLQLYITCHLNAVPVNDPEAPNKACTFVNGRWSIWNVTLKISKWEVCVCVLRNDNPFQMEVSWW